MVGRRPAGRRRGTSGGSRSRRGGPRRRPGGVCRPGSRPRADRLFAIAQRILRDVDRAEDAVQDALVIAWRDLRALRDPDRFDAWLRQLLINVCIARQAGNGVACATSGCCRSTPPDPGRKPHDRRPGPARTRVPAPASRAAGHAHAAPLRGLGDGGDRRDASAIPPGTVRSRLHNAHRAMRASLEADARAPAYWEVERHDADRDIERLLERLARRRPLRGARTMSSIESSTRAPPAPAARVAPPVEGAPHDAHRQADRSPWPPWSSSLPSPDSPCSAGPDGVIGGVAVPTASPTPVANALAAAVARRAPRRR